MRQLPGDRQVNVIVTSWQLVGSGNSGLRCVGIRVALVYASGCKARKRPIWNLDDDSISQHIFDTGDMELRHEKRNCTSAW